jgi:hypothetical protein
MNISWTQLASRTFHSLQQTLRASKQPPTIAVTDYRPSACTQLSPHRRTQRPPLRIIRMVDPSAKALHNGRIIMSGSMADVCAELDRLAALEAITS